MHFVTGGAYNGKRAWVKKVYHAEKQEGWISAYDKQPLPQDLIGIAANLLILEGIEIWLKALAEKYDLGKAREIWNQCLHKWLEWERAKDSRTLVIMGTDITKGIVPLEEDKRLWRDLAGWSYQDTAEKAGKMDIIWYGINQTIK